MGIKNRTQTKRKQRGLPTNMVVKKRASGSAFEVGAKETPQGSLGGVGRGVHVGNGLLTTVCMEKRAGRAHLKRQQY